MCGHCNELVSRSTLERHEMKRRRMSIVSISNNSEISEESDSDSVASSGKKTNTIILLQWFRCLNVEHPLRLRETRSIS